jgi:hypothetical protein
MAVRAEKISKNSRVSRLNLGHPAACQRQRRGVIPAQANGLGDEQG